MTHLWTGDEVAAAEAAAASGGPALVAFCAGHDPGGILQTAGDVLVAALRARVTGADALGRRWVDALGARAWPGDAELAAQLDAAAGRGPVPLLRSVPAALAGVAALLEDEAAEGVVLSVSTGEWAFDDDEDVDELGNGWVHLVPFGPDVDRGDARDFERTYGVAAPREPEAFAWFRHERGLGRARAALAEAGFRTV